MGRQGDRAYFEPRQEQERQAAALTTSAARAARLEIAYRYAMLIARLGYEAAAEIAARPDQPN